MLRLCSSKLPRNAIWIILLAALLQPSFADIAPKTLLRDIWILVDTTNLELKVMQGDRARAVFKNIAIGRNGSGYEKQKGDDKTPLGSFRIAWINKDSRYHRFYGINYPRRVHARMALDNELIDLATYRMVQAADERNTTPPQTTPLGGQIGIHGLGHADPKIHAALNWTHGCIALTNNQIVRLGRWIRKGTPVLIR